MLGRRLVDHNQAIGWNSRGHFFGAAAEAMRRILVEESCRKQRDKNGGGLMRVELQDPIASDPDSQLLALDTALPQKILWLQSPVLKIPPLKQY